MGNSGSRLKVPLVPQTKPVRAMRSSYVRPVAVSLSVDLTGMNTTFCIVEAHSGAVFHDLQPHEQRGRRQICSDNGVPLATMKPVSAKSFAVFDGSDTHVEPRFRIDVQRTPGYPPVVVAEFQDVATAETCRLFAEGHPEERVVLVCLERGSNLPPLAKEKNERNPNVVVVGRIRRPKTDGVVFEGREKMFIEAEAGVDLTLLSMIWCTRYEMYYRSVSSSGGYTQFIKADLMDDTAMVR